MLAKKNLNIYARYQCNSLSPVTSSAPGTCGELMQGYLDGQDFLINSPISLYAHVSVTLNDSGYIGESVERTQHVKVCRAVELTLKIFKCQHLGADIQVDSVIPRGKGLASSTSEITAAIVATAEALGESLSQDMLTYLIIQVDRSSDGIFLPGINKFNHLTGVLHENFGPPPPISFIVVDTGGEVSTTEFDRDHARSVAKSHQTQLKKGLSFLRRGFANRNSSLVSIGATISALVNQKVLPKPWFDALLKGTVEFGSLGVNCAHTGTVLGVMFDRTYTLEQPLLNRVQSLVGKDSILGVYPLIGGVVRSS